MTTQTPPAAPAAVQPERPEPEYMPVEEKESDLPEAPTPEEIEEAKKQLEKLTPTDFFFLMLQLEGYKKQEGFPEARSICFTELVSKKGIVINITTRGASGVEALIDIVNTINYAKRLKLAPREKYAQASQPPANTPHNSPAGAKPAPTGASPAAKPAAKQSPTATSASSQRSTDTPVLKEEDSFPAFELVADMHKGKVYWGVTTTEKYPKFATRVWDEVAAEIGITLADLDAGVVYDLSGYRAYYIRNDNGNPAKVIKLVKEG